MSEKSKKTAIEMRTEFLAQIISDLENNTAPWRNGMKKTGRAINAATGKAYSGINMLSLSYYNPLNQIDNRWMTYKQAKDKGYQVKKGEKGSTVFFYREYDKNTKKDFDRKKIEHLSKDERKAYEEKNVAHIITKTSVFNGSQIDGMPPLETTRSVDINDFQKTLIKNSQAPIEFINTKENFYSPGKDIISIANINLWESSEELTSTIMHEIMHSTGHESRLERNIKNAFGTPNYAREELVAEMGTVLALNENGFATDPSVFDNNKAYLKSWISMLKDKPALIVDIIKDAEKAFSYTQENIIEKELTKETTMADEKGKKIEIIQSARSAKWKNEKDEVIDIFVQKQPDGKNMLAFGKGENYGNSGKYDNSDGSFTLLSEYTDGLYWSFCYPDQTERLTLEEQKIFNDVMEKYNPDFKKTVSEQLSKNVFDGNQKLAVKYGTNQNIDVRKTFNLAHDLREDFIKEKEIAKEATMPKKETNVEQEKGAAKKPAPFNIINAKNFAQSIKNGSSVLLTEPNPQLVYSLATEKPFSGPNQLLAQQQLADKGLKTNEIVTFKQANEMGAGVKAGSKHAVVLSSYDAEKNESSNYFYFTKEDTTIKSEPKKLTFENVKPIECTSSEPEKYIADYLAASYLGVEFKAADGVKKEFQEKLSNQLDQAYEQKKFGKMYEIGHNANKIASAKVNALLPQKLDEKARDKNQEKNKGKDLGQSK